MKHLALSTLLLFGTTLAMAAPAYAQPGPPAANAANAITVPVTGTGPAGTFAGTFKLTQFAVNQGQAVANGLLSGVLTGTNGTVTSIVQSVSIPLQATGSTCQILHLDLGPLNLDLLGLQVTLNEIVLNINAQPGPGNLLGNLLCSVAGLLDNPTGLVGTLNRILGAL